MKYEVIVSGTDRSLGTFETLADAKTMLKAYCPSAVEVQESFLSVTFEGEGLQEFSIIRTE